LSWQGEYNDATEYDPDLCVFATQQLFSTYTLESLGLSDPDGPDEAGPVPEGPTFLTHQARLEQGCNYELMFPGDCALRMCQMWDEDVISRVEVADADGQLGFTHPRDIREWAAAFWVDDRVGLAWCRDVTEWFCDYQVQRRALDLADQRAQAASAGRAAARECLVNARRDGKGSLIDLDAAGLSRDAVIGAAALSISELGMPLGDHGRRAEAVGNTTG
jgi:hypothetical protein